MNERNILNNTPRVILNGIDDRSIVALPTLPLNTPIHLPLFYLQTQQGPDNKVVLVNNTNEFTAIFGIDSIDTNLDYFNHATALALRILAQGNAIYVRRIVRDTDVNNRAMEASTILAVTIDSATNTKPYIRTQDGSLILNNAGNPIEAIAAPDAALVAPNAPGWIPTFTYTDEAATPAAHVSTPINDVLGAVPAATGWIPTNTVVVKDSAGKYPGDVGYVNTLGYIWGSNEGITLKYKWLLPADYDTFNINNITTTQTIVIATKTYYPLFYFEANFKGSYGNNYGVKLWSANATATNNTQGDIDVINDQQAMIYNAQLVYRPTATSSSSVVRDILGEGLVQFTTKRNSFDFKTNLPLRINGLVTRYNDDGAETGLVPTFGPLGKVIQYQPNIAHLLNLIYAKEKEYSPNQAVLTSGYLLDIFTATDYNGINNYGYKIGTGSQLLLASRTYFLAGGADGDLTDATFETEIIKEITTNVENPAYPLLDMAKYPFSCVYDSGFSTAVKKAIMTWPSLRKNVHVAVGTHTVGDSFLSIAEEYSVGLDLVTTARNYSESDFWGTPACRTVVMAQSGVLINDPFTSRVSTVFQLAEFRAKYLGSGNGVIEPINNYETAPNNKLTILKSLSSHYLNEASRIKLWNEGLNYALSFDTKSFFFPGLQTVYGVQQSILSSEIIMQICADIELKADRVWRTLTNSISLTNDQFIERSNRLFTELTDGIYGNVVKVVPNTYFTPADIARGYSWVLDVTVYGNVPKTVGQVNVITKRSVTTA